MEEKQPLVSIIIPVYQVEKYIGNTIKSVLRQTYKNIEIILVDDGSTDESITNALAEVEREHFTEYKLVRQENKGLGEARNTGVDYANGEWIVFIDSDDTIQKDAIEKLLKNAISNSCDWVFSSFQVVELGDEWKAETKTDYDKNYSSEQLQELFLLRKKKVIIAGTLFNKNWYLVNQLRFSSIRFSEDQLMLWQAIIQAQKIGYVGDTLYNYLVRSGSIMNASKKEALFEAYCTYEMFSKQLQKDSRVINSVKKWMLSRWTLGCVRSATHVLPAHEFRVFCSKVKIKSHCVNLLSFSEMKAQISACILLVSVYLYYWLMQTEKR